MDSSSTFGDAENRPFVSVIVPVYNDARRLAKCLEALDKQTYAKDAYEVVVVDNASDESIKSVVAHFDQARSVYEACSGSYAARNRGIENARGEIIAFTDADCIPHVAWIERGVERLMRSPMCGLVGGRIDFFFRVPDNPTPAELYDSTRFLDQERYVKQGNYAATANAFTWKRLFKEVGLFNASLKSGGDTEWGHRVARHGYAVCYADKARVHHPARYSYRALRQKKLRVTKGTVVAKKARGYSLSELIVDVIKDFGHHVKFAVYTAHRGRNYGWKEKVVLLIAFVMQGGCTAFRRIQAWREV